MNPLATIQELYAAFARGDLPALLGRLSPDVEWRANVDPALPGAARVPCYAPGRGREFVAGYFAKLGAGYEIHAFDLRSFLAGGAEGREIAVRIEIDFTIRPTGRRIRGEVIHHWMLNESDEVTRFNDFEDTLGFVQAWS